MNRVPGVIIALLLPSFSHLHGQVRLTPPQIAARAQAAVVHITALDAGDTPVNTGTGFFIDSLGTFVTNYHVIGMASRLEVRVANGESFRDVYQVQVDSLADLALLRIAVASPSRFLALALQSTPVVGEEVFVMGDPLGLEGSFSSGLVSARRETRRRQWLQITAPISPGSSGGPVMDATGRVIGVAAAMVEGGQNLNLAVPVQQVAQLVARPAHVTLFRDAAAGRLATLTGFQDFAWGTTEGEVRRIRGVPEAVEQDDGYETLSYITQFAGEPAIEAFYFSPDKRLAFGQFFIYMQPLACVRVFQKVRAVIASRFPSVQPVERLEQPATGALCDQIVERTAHWSTRWDFDGGRIVQVLLPYGAMVALRVIWTPLDQ